MEGVRFSEVEANIRKQLRDVEDLSSKLQRNLARYLDETVDPRNKVGLAELLQSFAQLQRVLLDLNKQLVELPEKKLLLSRKQKELEMMEVNTSQLNVLALQKILYQLGVPVGMNPISSEGDSESESVVIPENKEQVSSNLLDGGISNEEG